MSFQDAVRSAFRHYATFSGRAARPEWWWFVLFGLLGGIVASIVDSVLFGTDDGLVSGLFSLALLLPTLAVGARRLHDVGRSGWWLLLGLVPLIGFLVLLWWFAQPGEPGPNRFGPPPAPLP